MASNFIFPEWLNANSVRGYPVSEYGTRMDLTGSVKLPDSLLVDASLAVHPDLATSTFFVSKVKLSPDGAEIEISRLDAAGSNVTVVTTIAAPASGGNYRPYSFTGVGDNYDVNGSIVVGDLWLASQEMSGVFEFTHESTPLEHTVLNVSLPMVRAIEIYNGSAKVGTFNGLLKLKAGRNIRLTYVDGETVRIDAIDGLNTTDPDSCAAVTPLGPPIRTINGVGPDENGNFQLEGGDCISVEAGSQGLVISDTCSQSCCGCDELAQLMSGLTALETQCQILKTNIYEVQANTSRMMAYIVAALA